jgi:hypothetical protein
MDANWDHFDRDVPGQAFLIRCLRYTPLEMLCSHIDIDSLFSFLVKNEMVEPIFYLVNCAGLQPQNSMACPDALITCVVSSCQNHSCVTTCDQEEQDKTRNNDSITMCMRRLVEGGYQTHQWKHLYSIAVSFENEIIVEAIARYMTPEALDEISFISEWLKTTPVG